MLDLTQNTSTISPPKENLVQWIRQLKEAGEPIALTVGGKAELVVRDATIYQMLLQLVDRLETLEGIRADLEDMEAGRTVSLEQARKELRRNNAMRRIRPR
jgi:PHD/YefM family antitoxin component YafN of YafNO toxin-antitoxin module